MIYIVYKVPYDNCIIEHCFLHNIDILSSVIFSRENNFAV